MFKTSCIFLIRSTIVWLSIMAPFAKSSVTYMNTVSALHSSSVGTYLRTCKGRQEDRYIINTFEYQQLNIALKMDLIFWHVVWWYATLSSAYKWFTTYEFQDFVSQNCWESEVLFIFICDMKKIIVKLIAKLVQNRILWKKYVF